MSKQPEERVVRVALHEIERLLREAGQSGMPVESWVEQVAGELRTALPELEAEDASDFARRMLADPRRALDAQARVEMRSLVALRQ